MFEELVCVFSEGLIYLVQMVKGALNQVDNVLVSRLEAVELENRDLRKGMTSV